MYGAGSVNEEVLAQTRASGDTLAIYNGGSAAGPDPATERFFFGFYAWPLGARGVFQWAYQWPEGDPVDDRDAFPRDWCYTYPTDSDPCAPTLQWEAVREGVLDLRYLQAAAAIVRDHDPECDRLGALLDGLRRDVEQYLRTNTRTRYLQEPADPTEIHPYTTLPRAFPASRLMAIRQELQRLLADLRQ